LQLRASAAIAPKKQSPLSRLPLLAVGLGAGVAVIGIVIWLVFRPAAPELPTPDDPTAQPEAQLNPPPAPTPLAPAPSAPTGAIAIPTVATPTIPPPVAPTPPPVVPAPPAVVAPGPSTPAKKIAASPGGKKKSKKGKTDGNGNQGDSSSLIDPFQ
jgi:hypothetical protein